MSERIVITPARGMQVLDNDRYRLPDGNRANALLYLWLAQKAVEDTVVTPSTTLSDLRVGIANDPYLFGAAVVLACRGGRYADESVRTLAEALQLVSDREYQLSPQLRVAAEIARNFHGTVGELTALVESVLAEQLT